MQIAYVSLGSNLDNPVEQLERAILQINVAKQIALQKKSSFYQSKPMVKSMVKSMKSIDQPLFVNAVISIKTEFSALQLLHYLQQVENQQGRVRDANRWGPRTIDCDILLYSDEMFNTEELTIPHYELKEREFVLYPLAEIAPDLVLPTGENVQNLLQNCPRNGLQLLEDKYNYKSLTLVQPTRYEKTT